MGVQTEKAMGNTCRKSEVKILEERQFNIDLGKEDPLTTSTHCYSIEETIIEAVVLLKSITG